MRIDTDRPPFSPELEVAGPPTPLVLDPAERWVVAVTMATTQPLDETTLIGLDLRAERRHGATVAARADAPGFVLTAEAFGAQVGDVVTFAAQLAPESRLVDLHVRTLGQYKTDALRGDPIAGVRERPGEPQGALGEPEVLEPVPADEVERDYASGVVPRPPERTDADRCRIAADVAAAKRDALVLKYRSEGLDEIDAQQAAAISLGEPAGCEDGVLLVVTARATRDGDGFWLVYVPEIDSYTQARTADGIEHMARDLVAAMRELAPEDVRVTVQLGN